ncbi:MAG: hypothetical protein HY909_19485 [Deltaproteobacteria bacterium]|nr:hypothetical protein [Deltaproteobacteria bacterium]
MRGGLSRRDLGRCAVAGATALVGCGSDIPTTFPPGLEPLEPNAAPRVAAQGADRYPEAITFERGKSDAFDWVHARANVKASLPRTWEALREPVVCIDRRRVHGWTITEGVEPEYPYSFRIHHVVRDIVTVEFDLVWRHGPLEGSAATPGRPTAVGARYQKVYGSSYIQLLRGSVVARQVDESVTGLEFIRHVKASSGGTDDLQQYLQDYYNSILARVRGQALPTY